MSLSDRAEDMRSRCAQFEINDSISHFLLLDEALRLIAEIAIRLERLEQDKAK